MAFVKGTSWPVSRRAKSSPGAPTCRPPPWWFLGRVDVASKGARENHGKTLGKLGKTLGTPWETMGKLGKSMGKLWLFGFFPGFWGDLVELNGIDLGCNLMGILMEFKQ